MMREMLKPSGVFAMCIDHRELYRAGLLLDGIFGEENRLAIVNWQKTTSKNNTRRVSQATEYILVYSKEVELTKTGLLERSSKATPGLATWTAILSVTGELDLWRPGAALNDDFQINPRSRLLHPPLRGGAGAWRSADTQ
ncbi:DNA methyltransferase [Sphingomonas sp. NIC1]|uniref:DNA methyltransferase n=1 Tax=Sphingomonas sp. NIC1 TaxID=1961362 RepID=UPI0007C0F9F6|nr:DNA methyltransferase [Sphingomonas sp. NIC1]ANC88544.1 hypothetical protein A7E77_15875 [Sphingomonas sp. NIC1]